MKLAGAEGLEPPLLVLETSVLPIELSTYMEWMTGLEPAISSLEDWCPTIEPHPRIYFGAEEGIRTPVSLATLTVFKTAPV